MTSGISEEESGAKKHGDREAIVQQYEKKKVSRATESSSVLTITIDKHCNIKRNRYKALSEVVYLPRTCYR